MDVTVQTFKALSEEIRLRLIMLLLEGELCVCDLMAGLDLPQSTVSRHLSYLRNTGWVEGHRQGLWMYYRLAEELPILHRDLLHVLQQSLSDKEQTRADHKRFTEYMRTKKPDRCD